MVHSLTTCRLLRLFSGSIQCLIRSGMIPAFKNSARKSSSEPAPSSSAHSSQTKPIGLSVNRTPNTSLGMKYYWEVVADKLSKAGWSLGWVSALDLEGRTIWIVDAHRDDGRRFIVQADEKLSAFVEL